MSEFFTPTDMRRAWALLVAHAGGDTAGRRAVLAEADAAGAALDLAAALCQVCFAVNPSLATPMGAQFVRGQAVAWAGEETALDQAAERHEDGTP